MQLIDRDHLVLTYVSKFGFTTSKQLQHWVFSESKSTKSSYRSFHRLLEANYLATLPLRYPGNSKGGNTPHIYKLGSNGQRLFTHRATPPTSKLLHTLKIGDCFSELLTLDRTGSIRLLDWATEPDCHFDVEGDGNTYYVRPDMRITIERLGRRMPRLLEIDMDSQSDADIRKKFARYIGAGQYADEFMWPEGQIVWFIAISKGRAEALKRLLATNVQEHRGWFRVMTLEEMVHSLSLSRVIHRLGRTFLLT